MSLIGALRLAMFSHIIFFNVSVQATPVSSQSTNRTAAATESIGEFDGKDRSQRLDNHRREHINRYHSDRDDLLERIAVAVDDITLQSRIHDHDRQLSRLAQLQQQDALLQKQAIDDAVRDSFRQSIAEEVERIRQLALNHSLELTNDQQLDERRHSTLIRWVNETRNGLQRQVEREMLLTASVSNASTDRLLRGLNELRMILKQGEDNLMTINSSLIDEIRRPQVKDELASSDRRVILDRVDELRELMINISVEQTQQRELFRKYHREVMAEMNVLNGSMSRLREVDQHLTRQDQQMVALNASFSTLHVDNRQTQTDVKQIETRLSDRLQQMQRKLSRDSDERQRRLEILLQRISERVAAEAEPSCLITRPNNRTIDGWPGITPAECRARGSCFDDTVPDVPWCFRHEDVCRAVKPSDRENCGWPGISREECVSRSCCFDSSIVNVHWCFRPDEEFSKLPEVYKCAETGQPQPSCTRTEPRNRTSGGLPGITPDQCFAKGNCFDSSVPNVSWCFKHADYHSKCNLDIVAYSAFDPCNAPNDGYVSVNGRRVWEAGWGSSKPNLRGINTRILDPVECSVSDSRRFDTWLSVSQAHDFVAYFDYLQPGTLLIGATGDEPTQYLEPALPRLRAAGVRVEDVQSRGSFAFVIQIGHPENTVFVKSLTNVQRTIRLQASIIGTTERKLKITRD